MKVILLGYSKIFHVAVNMMIVGSLKERMSLMTSNGKI